MFVCLMLSKQTAAQVKLSGVIRDAVTKEVVAFAHITYQHSSIGTSSNTEGYFELSTVEQTKWDSIVVSHINYETKKLSLASLDISTINSIVLNPSTSMLQEVVVQSKTPFEYLMDVIAKAKEDLRHPFSSTFYYRELVKDNGDYSKYSDAILIGNFPADKEDMQVGAEEVRVVNLPKENDDVFDMISPIDLSRLLEFQYLNFLNRFLGEKRKYYDFQMKVEANNPSRIIYEITPVVLPEKNTPLYTGWIVTEDDHIKHVKIESDKRMDWQKSLLGMTAKMNSFSIVLNFNEVHERSVLVHGQIRIDMDFLYKKINQRNEYLSEFVALGGTEDGLSKIEKRKLLKSKTLYKHGSDYTTNFWEGNNIPIRTEEERKLLDRLAAYDQSPKSKKVK